MSSHVTTNIFPIDGLPNFLMYGAPLVRLQRAGPPLYTQHFTREESQKVCMI